MPGYYNPLAHANVRPERVDQGVDYAGSGYLVAIADAYIGESTRDGSGWEGEGYLNYKIVQSGSLSGAWVFYAEGIYPTVPGGVRVNGGQQIAVLRAYQPHGIEIGFAAGVGELSYHAYHDGGYDENSSTRAGIAFNNLIRALGGPGGIVNSRVTGNFPAFMPAGIPGGDIAGGGRPITAPLGGPGVSNAPGAAGAYTWPGAYYSAMVQMQRGVGQGAHHSNSGWVYARGVTYKPAAVR